MYEFLGKIFDELYEHLGSYTHTKNFLFGKMDFHILHVENRNRKKYLEINCEFDLILFTALSLPGCSNRYGIFVVL